MLNRRVCFIVALAFVTSSVVLLAQKPDSTGNTSNKGIGLLHDVSGVWNGAAAAPPAAGTAPAAPKPPAAAAAVGMVPKDVTMTPWAQAKFDAAKGGIDSTLDPYRDCEPLGPTRWVQYVHPFEIVQTPDRLFFFYEIAHLWRVVYMDGRPLPKVEDLKFGPTYMGYSVGHWDGDDLVVETMGVTDKTWIDTSGHPHSDDMRLTERYHRVNHDSLQLSFTFDDPKAYSKTFTYGPRRYELKTGPLWEIQESECLLSDEKGFEENVSNGLNGVKNTK